MPRNQDLKISMKICTTHDAPITRKMLSYLIDFLSSFFSVSFSSTSIGFIFYNSIPTFLLTFEIPSSWQIFLNSSSSIHPLPLLSHLLNNISNRLDMIHWYWKSFSVWNELQFHCNPGFIKHTKCSLFLNVIVIFGCA